MKPQLQNPTPLQKKIAAIAMAAHLSRSAVRSLFRQIAPSISSRSFAAASAAASYESEWEEDDEGGHVARPKVDTWGEMEGRGVQWVFMGSATKKKHLYANRLAEILEVPYISMGNLVRQELDPTSSIYIKIANAVNEGKLVPEDIIFGLLSKRLEEGHRRGETGFILDGIPRTRFQAEILDQIADIDLVVNFKSVEDCLVKKDFGIGVCTHCGKSFDASNSESTSINSCLVTRTRHSQLKASSAIDKEESHLEKFRSYTEQSKLLEEYYRNQKKLIDFQVAGGPGETWRGLLAALHLQHIDAVTVARKLTT